MITALFLSCLSIKPGGVRSSKTLYEEFFVGEDGTQYFIKPLDFNTESKELLKLDITFRYKNEIKDSARFNISLLGEDVIKKIDSVQIKNDSKVISLNNVSLIFVSKEKKYINCRFLSTCPLDEVCEMFANSQWQIDIYYNGKQKCYTASKKTEKSIGLLQANIFVLF